MPAASSSPSWLNCWSVQGSDPGPPWLLLPPPEGSHAMLWLELHTRAAPTCNLPARPRPACPLPTARHLDVSLAISKPAHPMLSSVPAQNSFCPSQQLGSSLSKAFRLQTRRVLGLPSTSLSAVPQPLTDPVDSFQPGGSCNSCQPGAGSGPRLLRPLPQLPDRSACSLSRKPGVCVPAQAVIFTHEWTREL